MAVHAIHFRVLLLLARVAPVLERLDADEGERVADQVALNFLVEWRIAAERWTQVDFEEPAVHELIDQDVESEKLEAVIRIRHVLLKRLIDMGLTCNNRLDNNILNLLPYRQIVDSNTFHELPESS